MAKIPVDTRAVTFIAAGPAEPVLANRDTGELAVDRAGRRQYQVHVMALLPAAGEKPQMWTVKLAGDEPAPIAAGAAVAFEGLVVSDWEVEGRHGLSYRADAVTTTGSAPASAGADSPAAVPPPAPAPPPAPSSGSSGRRSGA